MDMIGQTISHYMILERIGEGGMGEVYKAQDLKLDRIVALKILPSNLTPSNSDRQRFIQEAKAASALDHPNICTVYEADESADGRMFIAMAYYDGETLQEKLGEDPLSIEDAVTYAIQIAEGLRTANDKNVVHRDLKPGNIMVTKSGQVKIMDFGLAKTSAATTLTSAGTTIGTVPYMSPEQARGDEVDHRTDLWSFGVMLYQLIAGRLPFKSAYNEAIVYAILNERPDPLTSLRKDVPVSLERIVNRALQKNPQERYQRAEELLADLKAVQAGDDGAGRHQGKGKKTWVRPWLGLGAGVLLVGLVALYIASLSHSPTSASPDTRSIAVLPFVNTSGDSNDEYFSDGITETIIAHLAMIGELKVISHASVMQFRTTAKNVREIGKELKVTHVLEGSVLRSGKRVRIVAQLIDARTDTLTWANTYERDISDILLVQSDVSRDIAKVLKLTLAPDIQAQLEKRPTTSLEAYDQYLRGKFYSHGSTGIKADIDTAIVLFERAVTLDPTFALAYADLARSYAMKYFFFEPQQKRWEEKAFVDIEKALSLDPNLPYAYVARGFLYWTPSHHFPHEMAVREYRHALALNPNLDDAYEQLATIHVHVGLLDTAIQEAKRALDINPVNAGAQFRVGVAYLYQGRYEEALRIFQELRGRINPSLLGLQTALALFHLGKIEEASSMLGKLVKEFPLDPLLVSGQAVTLVAAGKNEKALEKVRTVMKMENQYLGHFHHAAYDIACVYALMRKNPLALEWLKKAADDGFPCYPSFERDPNLDNLRSDPEFIAFMETLRKQWEYFREKL